MLRASTIVCLTAVNFISYLGLVQLFWDFGHSQLDQIALTTGATANAKIGNASMQPPKLKTIEDKIFVQNSPEQHFTPMIQAEFSTTSVTDSFKETLQLISSCKSYHGFSYAPLLGKEGIAAEGMLSDLCAILDDDAQVTLWPYAARLAPHTGHRLFDQWFLLRLLLHDRPSSFSLQP